MPQDIIEATIAFVKEELYGAEKGHDWWHAWRVWQLCRELLKTEQGNVRLCELGALLHDISDHKFNDGNEEKGLLKAEKFMKSIKLSPDEISSVIDICKNISFKGGLKETTEKSPELKIVQDADRLDAMGAIGIARSFHYGGFRNRCIYDPGIPPKTYSSAEEYRNSESPTLNHFHEKLLLLKDKMNTPTGKRMAERRHRFMLDFLTEFFNEWAGK